MSKNSAKGIRRAFGLDYQFIARWVAIHEKQCSCAPPPTRANDEVWWYGICARCGGRAVDAFDAHQISHMLGHGEAKAAVTMKYATDEGFATKLKGGERLTWRPTDKARKTFPPGQPHVLPDPEPVEGDFGTFTPLTPEKIRELTAGQLEPGHDFGGEVGGTYHKKQPKELPDGND